MGVALYSAYAADVNMDSSALKDAVVDCSTTWDESEFQSPTVRMNGGLSRLHSADEDVW